MCVSLAASDRDGEQSCFRRVSVEKRQLILASVGQPENGVAGSGEDSIGSAIAREGLPGRRGVVDEKNRFRTQVRDCEFAAVTRISDPDRLSDAITRRGQGSNAIRG